MGLATDYRGGDMKNVAWFGGWLVLLLAGIFAYIPGLGGPFVFDDLDSIDALGDLGGVRDWATFKAFVLGGTAGPTGRPLALLSFLLDGNTWPTDPWPFKRTNLVIHLLNGALLGVLVSKILRLLDYDKNDVRWIALISAACWLLHPFLVSTTLYVVQRMAQLSTLFIFAGLVGHLYGRSMLQRDELKAYLIMTLSLGLFTFLAMISKENGILLPVLVGVLEITVLANQRTRISTLDRRWTIVFLVMPSLVITAYLGERLFSPSFFDIVPPRDFSIYERVLTQPRILLDYLQNWFVPKLYTTGVFQDHYIKSTGILSPITTLLSALLHLALVSLAIVFRSKRPLLALAILFFYAGHVLESTVLNLELYFEHRNYLPACFLFVPVIAFLRQKMRRQLFVAVALGLVLVLTGFTRFSATVWQDYSSMVEASAQKAPTSTRAQAEHARDLFNSGRYEESLQVMDRAIASVPYDRPHLLVNRLTMLCSLNILNANEFDRVAERVSDTVYDSRLISIYQEFISAVTEGQCKDVSLTALRDMFVRMLDVSQNADQQSSRYAQIKYFVGFVEAHNGKPERAVKVFEDSLRVQSDAAMAMNMAALLATNGYFEEALKFSIIAMTELRNSPAGLVKRDGVTETDIREFQAIVRVDMDDSQAGDTSRPIP